MQVRKTVDILSAPGSGRCPNLVDGSAPGADVELSARLSDQLALLALGVAGDRTDLGDDLTLLVSTLTSSVSGYAGLRVTILHTGQPVRLTVLTPARPDDRVVTSLRMPLRPVSDVFEDGGRLVVWSTVPGSLVDLAADLTYVLRRVGDPTAPQASSAVELDVDLPPPVSGSGVEGLEELATIHRAAGLLIERGHEASSVQASLRRQASVEGLSTLAWAEELLRRA